MAPGLLLCWVDHFTYNNFPFLVQYALEFISLELGDVLHMFILVNLSCGNDRLEYDVREERRRELEFLEKVFSYFLFFSFN